MGSIYHVLKGGPFLGFRGLARGPAVANRDDPFDGYSCFSIELTWQPRFSASLRVIALCKVFLELQLASV